MKGVFKQIARIFGARKQISQEQLESIEELLLKTDIGVETTDEILAILHELKTDERIYPILTQNFLSHLKKSSFFPLNKRPEVICFFGVNGTGKTTCIGKIVMHMRKRAGDIGIVFAAADTFRAAAVEQLAVHAEKTNARLVSQGLKADPAAVVYDAIESAKSRGDYVVLIDTAGRMHNNTQLMGELQKIQRVIQKHDVSCRNIQVLDANTGKNAITQVEMFHKAVGVDGIILTKMDSAAHGGVLIPIAKQYKIPCIGLADGEGYDNYREFDPDAFVRGLLEEIADD